MRNFFLALVLICSITLIPKNSYSLEPKTKAFLVMTAYGTVGGALLGFATMAFGASSRAIAQGASLGLYAGIGFGSYIITSHRPGAATGDPYGGGYTDPMMGPTPMGPDAGGYPAPMDSEGTQGGFGEPQGGGGFGAPAPEQDSGGFFGAPNRSLEISQEYFRSYRALETKRGSVNLPPLYLNLYYQTF